MENRMFRKPLTYLVVLLLFFINPQISNAQESPSGNDVVIIDTELGDYKVLENDFSKGAKVQYFDPQAGIIGSIENALKENAPVKSLHIITHGTPGGISLSYDFLNEAIARENSEKLASLKGYFANGADILIYGCNVASSEEGKQFVNYLSDILSVDVAASTDITGNSNVGGNWNLEYKKGKVEANALESANYKYTLDKVLVFDTDGASYFNGSTISAFYSNKGYPGTTVTSLPASLAGYQLVWIIQPNRSLTDNEISLLKSYLDSGGLMVMMGEHNGYTPQQNQNISDAVKRLGAHFSIVNESTDGNWTTCGLNMKANGVIKDHPLMEGVNTLDYNYIAPIAMGGNAQVLCTHRTVPSQTYIALEGVSNGNIVMWADQNIWDNVGQTGCNNNAIFFLNLLKYSSSTMASVSTAVLTTTEAYSISGNSAKSGGIITNDKGSAITQRGVCWSTSTSSPTTSDNKVTTATAGSGSFTCDLTGLSLNTKYYARAFAVNSKGTAYGNTVIFTTPAVANTAPTAVTDNYSCIKGSSITGNVMSNDFDDDGDQMTAVLVTAPSYNSGTFTLSSNGSFTYSNNGTAAPSDFFSYYLTDGKSKSATVGVSISIYTNSNPPVGGNGTVTTVAKNDFSFAASDFTFSDADANHTFNGIKIVTLPSSGTLKYNGFSVTAGAICNDVTKLTFNGTKNSSFTFNIIASSAEISLSAYTMTITVTGGTQDATVTLSQLAQTYTGSPISATVVTVPSGLSYSITYNNSSSEPKNAGTYAVVATITADGYTGSASGNLIIGKAPLNITNAIVQTKQYDGGKTASITGATLAGVLNSDEVVLNTAFGTFSQSTIGNDLSVIPAFTISGKDTANYSLTQPSGLKASITPKGLTVANAAAQSKIYDGKTTAKILGALTGIVGSENVTIADSIGAFAQSGIGTDISVTPALTIAGSDKANYTL
ncbi:MAG: DUF4347 domain-containing protein, partial [Bacteroidota bacterium]|nr:DUF4347 domain-containing protein [Bacteroidota bacterium]